MAWFIIAWIIGITAILVSAVVSIWVFVSLFRRRE